MPLGAAVRRWLWDMRGMADGPAGAVSGLAEDWFRSSGEMLWDGPGVAEVASIRSAPGVGPDGTNQRHARGGIRSATAGVTPSTRTDRPSAAGLPSARTWAERRRSAVAGAAMPGRRAPETEVLNALGCGLAGQGHRVASRLGAVTEVPALCPGALLWRLPRMISPVRLPPSRGKQNDAPMSCQGFGWHFGGLVFWGSGGAVRAGLLGWTRQGGAARGGGQALMRSRPAGQGGGARGRPANRSQASTGAAAD
jgi:hypothetical protein